MNRVGWGGGLLARLAKNHIIIIFSVYMCLLLFFACCSGVAELPIASLLQCMFTILYPCKQILTC